VSSDLVGAEGRAGKRSKVGRTLECSFNCLVMQAAIGALLASAVLPATIWLESPSHHLLVF
jgi:hypothetical protein